MPDYALAIGGKTELDATGWWGSKLQPTNYKAWEAYQSGKNMYLNEADLYVVGNLGHYVQAAVTFTGASYANPAIEEGYVNLGNLTQTPFYLTVGKNRLSFGSFADGAPWLGGITQALFRPGHNTISANLGYDKNGLNVNAAYFQANSQSSDFMGSVFYDGHADGFNFGGNAGYMYNWIGTGVTVVQNAQQGATGDTVNENRNGVGNLEGYAGYDIYLLNAGWSTTTNKEAYSNNSRLGAWYLQGSVSPSILGRATQFSLGYQQAHNTQNLPFTLAGDSVNAPLVNGVHSEFIAYVSRPVLSKYNIVSLEYGYLHMYNQQHTNEVTLDMATYF